MRAMLNYADAVKLLAPATTGWSRHWTGWPADYCWWARVVEAHCWPACSMPRVSWPGSAANWSPASATGFAG
jgi:hypothetical protein